MKTLILYADYSNTSSYYDDWHDAFMDDTDLNCESLDICKINIKDLSRKIKSYELIVMLHSTNADNLSYALNLIDILNERSGKLAVFAGNEVNIPGISMAGRISFFKELNADYIFTQLLEETGRWLYNDCTDSEVIAIPHALNAKVFKPIKSLSERKINIGVRSFKYNTHLGDNERTLLFQTMEKKLLSLGISSDISFDPNKRFSRAEWAKFLQQSKGTIATEAGTYYLEKDDTLVLQVQDYLYNCRSNSHGTTINNNSIISRSYRKLPKYIKELIKLIYYKYSEKLNIKHEYMLSDDIPFETVYQNIIINYPKCPYYSKAISSRHFDAIGTKTCLLMLEGRYNDILLAEEHYLEIKKDFSNIDSVIEQFTDLDNIEKITTRAWEYVMENHQHTHRISTIKQLFNKGR